MMVRLLMWLHFPRMLFESIIQSADTNSLMKNKDKMCGLINITSAPVIHLDEIKQLSKKLGVTINDVILSSLTTALHSLFQDRNEDVKEVKLTIPANIRFQFYNNREDVKLENKFAAIPLTVPVTESMSKAYDKVTKISSVLRQNFSLVYSYYALIFWSQFLLPRLAALYGLGQVSKKFTMAFSNTPGPIKPFTYKKDGSVIRNLHAQSYIMVSGQIGLALNCVS